MSIDLDRWSNSSTLLVDLGERYRVQMNFEVSCREIFSQMSCKTRTQEVKLRKTRNIIAEDEN